MSPSPGDLAELTKPGITLMVLVTTGAGFFLASTGRPDLLLLGATLLGTALVSAGGSALNQYLERDTDALMRRTARRPLPAGRIGVRSALVFGGTLSAAGLAVLGGAVNLLTAVLGLAALAGYVLVYTPLKRLTPLATVVGAIPGALPPVMGWAAVRGDLGAGAWALFGILFLWQLPHFLAIAWLCRGDYALAGFPMLTVVDPGGGSAGRQSLLYGAALLPISVLPSVLGLAGGLYFLGALLAGLVFLGACIGFSIACSSRSARRLLLVSVLYLPAVLVAMVLDRVI